MSLIPPNLRRRLALAALLLACALLPTSFAQPPAEPADSPIKQVPVRPEHIVKEMERLGLKALERLSRDEFERRQRAALSPPQLLEARYFGAELSGDALVGKGAWKVRHTGPGLAVLPLSAPNQPLTVAVRQPRFDNREAVVAEFEGLGTGLLLDRSGEQTVNFDWSARQEPGTDGIRFQLGLPSANPPEFPVASMELDLPANLLVTADGLPVTGPLPADKPDLKRWRIAFSRRPALTLSLRRRPEAGEPRVLLAGPLLTRQKLTPDGVEADFTFSNLQARSGEFRELTCVLDSTLSPYDVTVPELESWTVHAPASPGAPATLLIRLREPLLSGSLVVRCLALLGTGSDKGNSAQPWTAPGLRLRDAVPSGETLLLQVHPEVSLEGWDPGGFRLVDAKGEAEGQTLKLVGGLIEGDAKMPGGPKPAGRPTARVRGSGTDFSARQLAVWKPDPDHPSYAASITYEVFRGRLFRLPLELPAGYDDVEAVTISPARLLRNWELKNERGKTLLLVDLARPLAPEGKLRLLVRLRPSSAPPHGLAWPLPDLVPLGARLREGGLAIDFDEQRFEGRLTGAALTTIPPRDEGPWGGEVPDYYGTYRGEPLRGRLELLPLPPRLRAHAQGNLVLMPGHATLETRLQLQADAGTPQSLDVCVSARLAGRWGWKTIGSDNDVKSFERLSQREVAAGLHTLAARDALGAAALLAATPQGEWRRLTLRRPLKPRESLTLQAISDLLPAAEGRWEVPLLAAPGAESGDGELALSLVGAAPVQVEAVGLREAQPNAVRAGAAPPWRTFRYGAPPVALTLHGSPPAPERAGGAAIDRAVLTTAVEPDGRLLHLFRFQLGGWREPSLPLRLPAGARVLSLKINGQWIDRLPPAAEEDGTLRVDLPVPDRNGLGDEPQRRYEVVYATAGPGGGLWTRLEAPAPTLPLTPLVFLRRWRLPPGLVPLRDSRVHPLPSVATERDEWKRETNDLGSLSSLVLRPLAIDSESRQRQEVAAAARSLRLPVGRPLTLGESLERVACAASAEHDPLVIDALALEEAGLAPASVVTTVEPGKDGAPFWETLGLVHVPCRAAALLTTQRRLDAWQAAGRDAGTSPPSVEAAVAEAAANDHDTSGRFLWAVAWARRGTASRPPSGASLFETVAPGWTEWEPVAGGEDDSRLTAVRRDPIRVAGLALAGVLIGGFWAVRRRAVRLRLALLLVWLAAAGALLLWLPASLHGLAWPPLLAGAVVSLAWYLWSATRSTAPRAASSVRPAVRGAAAAGLLALVGSAALLSQAAPPSLPRGTVLVVSGPPEAPEQTVVLAPRDLLKQLDTLARAPHGAVIAAAAYEGKAAGDHAEFEARLLVHSFEDSPVTLPLPFGDVRLQDDGWLDGARAYLKAAPAGQTGLVLTIEKPGPHVLVLHFRAALTANQSEREVRFRAPQVPQSQLTLAVPATASYFQASPRLGSLSRLETAPGAAVSRYAVDLGRTDGPLIFRWHEEAGAPPEPALSVREAYLWNLKPDTATLSAVLRCTVTRGAPTTLALDLPEGLVVQDVAARSAEAGQPAPALKPWRVEPVNGKRRLRLDFAAPIPSGIYVVVRLVPGRPLLPLDTLPVPTPVGVQFGGGFLAYRADGIEVHVANSGRLRGPYSGAAGVKESKEFNDLWLASGAGGDILSSLPAPHALQRGSGGEPFLQVALRVAAPAVRGRQKVTWSIGARQADLSAVARLTTPNGDPAAPNGNLSLVEWEVPGDVVVTKVSSHDNRDPVWRWSRSGNRVQAWLSRTTASAEVELSGWKELVPERDGLRFDLPGVRLLTTPGDATWLHLSAEKDFALEPGETSTLQPLPDARASEQDWTYAARGPVYGGRFHVRRITAGAEARVLTILEAATGRLHLTAHVEYRAAAGSVELRLRRWDGEVRLDLPRGARRRSETRGPGGEHSWVIDLPSSTSPVMLTLSGTGPLPAAGACPDVTVSGAARLERWLVVGGPGLSAEGGKRLAALPAGPRGGPELPEAWRTETARLLGEGGSLWSADGAAEGLRLLAHHRPQGEAPLRVALTERTSAVVDGRHWVHEVVIWLYHEANTDLDVSLPEGAHILAVSLDGLPVTPREEPGGNLRVPLPGSAGACCLRLRWNFDPDAESLERPRLQRPQLRSAEEGPVVWTVHVPADYVSSFQSEEGRSRVTPSAPAALDLARAEAQYQLSKSLSEGLSAAPATALTQAQRRFYQFCRYAEAGRLLTGGAATANRHGQNFDDWLQDLREKNRRLAHDHNFEELRARAEREASEAAPLILEPAESGELPDVVGLRGDPLPERGTPLRWQTGPEIEAPRLLLTPLSDQQTRRAAGASVLLLILLVVVWALAHFPGVLAWVRAFWPEQVALLGCLGWQTYGPALPLLLLIGLGVSARVLFLGRRLLALLHRPPSEPSKPPSGLGSGLTVEPRPSGT
jgi:hypothetical protein